MKKVILNQISKAVAGGSNYFYLPLHLVEDKAVGDHYETTADLSKLFELDSNSVPVVKEICVYDEDNPKIMYLSYCGGRSGIFKYNCNYSKNTHEILIDEEVRFDDIVIVEPNTDETNDNSSPKDGGK